MKRAVFLADGASDLPLADHLGDMCTERGMDVVVTPVDARLLGAGRTVVRRLARLAEQGDYCDLVFVHRDAEGQGVDPRRTEIRAAAEMAGVTVPLVPVVPVRMTEAWLLLDEAAIRMVAGRPNGRSSLDLPTLGEVERLADPKALLRECLLTASETTGRRRDDFTRDFGRHRSLLIQRLDRTGPIRNLDA